MSFKEAQMKKNNGFTLVELAVVIVIIGVIAAFAVPRFRDAVERSKAAEAVNFMTSIRSAQERYNARLGSYTTNLADLDISMGTPKYFSVGDVAVGSTGSIENSWTLTLSRVGASAGYGNYTVVFTQSGFSTTDSSVYTITTINPMAQ
jgi:prepilin-type N-terminal cleavage/methylation domain-containing protein